MKRASSRKPRLVQLEEMDRGFQWHTKIYVLASMLERGQAGKKVIDKGRQDWGRSLVGLDILYGRVLIECFIS